jgi:hypothetical protein
MFEFSYLLRSHFILKLKLYFLMFDAIFLFIILIIFKHKKHVLYNTRYTSVYTQLYL